MAEMERHREEREARERRWNIRAGTITAAVYNAQGAKRDGGGAWRASDFFDVGEPEPKGQTPEQMKAVAQMWGAVFSGLPRSKS
jgi:hypothetical protein